MSIHDLPLFQAPYDNAAWCRQIFDAKAAQRGGIVRRSVRSVEMEIGRERLLQEVKGRGFHLLECGGQFIIICNRGRIDMHC